MARSVLASSLLLSSLLALAACGGSSGASLGTCPAGDSSAQQLAGRHVVQGKCVVCHSSALSGAARQEAPAGLDYDKLDIVRAETSRMFDQAGSSQMPPNNPLSASEIESLRVWLACGAPDVM